MTDSSFTNGVISAVIILATVGISALVSRMETIKAVSEECRNMGKTKLGKTIYLCAPAELRTPVQPLT